MNPVEQLLNNAKTIEKQIGYTFHEKNLLSLSFLHRSFVNENRSITEDHNERLEFLGDSILGLMVADYLYRSRPTLSEGELSRLRSRLVESSSCYSYMQKLEVSSFLLLGKGEKMNDGRGRESILADLFEALIGAIYLDGGLDAVKKFFFENFAEVIEDILADPQRNWKAELQDWAQKKYQLTPTYVVKSEEGPDHSKLFCISVFIAEDEVGTGNGSSKKEAQQNAAEDALSRLTTDK
ncbi:MAG: ribonuclease III [Parachlamydiales bacterium]|nr:ribonuclease III [Parachlamydiales bacterium]